MRSSTARGQRGASRSPSTRARRATRTRTIHASPRSSRACTFRRRSSSAGAGPEETAELEELARNPLFELGNHTFTHPHLTRIDEVRIRDELLRTQEAIASRTGRVPTLFRPPYGEYDARVLRIAGTLGLTTVEYDLASGDPDAHATRQALVDWVLREARAGSIIVMHINHRRFHTAEALPEIVDGLRARGFELVKVSDLLRPAQSSPPLVSWQAAAAHPLARTTAPDPAGPGKRAHGV